MSLRAVITTVSPTGEEKREALRAVLQTPTFSRSSQLRNFLSFICEMEIAGRAAEISEYVIGVEALGRPPGYSTTDDSTVRRHAHALRQKLEEAYGGEASGATLRIELPKGTYVPRYVLLEPAPPSRAAAEEARVPAPRPEPRDAAPAVRASGPRWWLMAAAFVAGALAMVPLAWRASEPARDVDPVLHEAWAPFDRPDSNPLVCVSAPAHIGILPYPDDGALPDDVDVVASSRRDLIDWYQQRYPLRSGHRLATHLTPGPIRLGEVLALVAAIKLLDQFGVAFQLVAERNVEVPALLGRNLILLANPEYSFAAGKLMESVAWTVSYDPETRRRVVHPARPDAAEKRRFSAPAGSSVVFGLISVLPSGGSRDGGHKTIVVSCTNAAGCHSAMEFLTSPPQMARLRARFVEEGHSGFPRAYQVVIRSNVYHTQALSGEYAGHTVLR